MPPNMNHDCYNILDVIHFKHREGRESLGGCNLTPVVMVV